jgi:uncharacterized membrane protein
VNTNGNLSRGERIGSALIGLGAIWFLGRSRGPLGKFIGGTLGTSLIGRAFAGHCGMKAALTKQTSFRQGISDQWSHTTQMARSLTGRRQGSGVQRIEKKIVVDRPLRTVYNQWTQFESFPAFMAGVQEVRQIDDAHVHWRAEVWGKEVEWDAEITEQEPDKRISWKSISGAPNAGTVRFEPLGDSRTRVRLVMAYEPEGAVENIGDALGLFEQQVQTSVEQFKKFIESRGVETGAWRGEVEDSRAH